MLAGGSRSGGKITVTYIRTPEWLKEHGKNTATPEVQPTMSSTKSIADELTKLAALKHDGAITEEEYEQLKKGLLTG